MSVAGGTIQIDNTSSIREGGAVRGFGRVETTGFNDLVNDGLIRARGGTLHIRRNGGTGAFNWDGDGEFGAELRVEASSTMLIDMPIDEAGDDGFNGKITVGSDGALLVNHDWQLDDPGTDLDDGVIELFGNDGPATIGGIGDLAMNESSARITVKFGTGRIASDLSVQGGLVRTVAGTTLQLDGDASFSDGSQLRLDGNLVVNGETDISGGIFDWDGSAASTTTIGENGSLSILSDSIDVGNNTFNTDTITVNSGNLLVKTAADVWELGSDSTLRLNNTNGTAPLISGSSLKLFGNVTVTGGDAIYADAAATLYTSSTTNIHIPSGRFANLARFAELAGGTYTGDGILDLFGFDGTRVVSDTTIDTRITDLDAGEGLLVEDGVKFAINSEQIELGDPNTQGFDSDLTINPGAELAIHTTLPWLMEGELRMAGGRLSGSRMIVTGTITDLPLGFANEIAAPITFRPTADVSIPTGNLIRLSGDTIHDGGNFGTTGLLEQASDATVMSSTTIAIDHFDWDVTSSQTLRIAAGATFAILAETGDFHAQSIRVENLARLLVDGPTQTSWTLGSASTLRLEGGPLPTPLAIVGGGDSLINDGVITGNGQFAVALTNRNGSLRPGNGVGVIVAQQSFVQQTGGTLEIALGGLVPISEFGRVTVGTVATLDGTLDVSLAGAFIPSMGDAFDILTAGSGFNGTFQTVLFPLLSNGLSFAIDYSDPNVVRLRVVGPDCDLNGNGTCDLADIDALVMEVASSGNNLLFDLNGDAVVNVDDVDAWLMAAGITNLGQPYLAGDANLDGVVDVSDFGVWNANKFTSTGKWSQADFNADGQTDVSDFGVWNANKFQSSLAAVPEPAAELLLFPLGILGILVRGASSAFTGRVGNRRG